MSHANWPRLMRTLADLVGTQIALKIVRRYGGLSNVRIPASQDTPHPWTELMTEDAWAKIVAALGGQRVDVPRGAHLRLLKEVILDLIEKHPELHDGEIALRVGCTQRYVRSLRGPHSRPADPRQMGLFDDC